MAKAGQAQDQAMDEILASIRRIIQDEDVRKSGVRASVQLDDAEDGRSETAGRVSRLFPEDAKDEIVEDVPDVKEMTPATDDNVVELAIAQAMEAARAEMSAGEKAAEPAPVRRAEPRAAPVASPRPPAPLLSPRVDAAVSNSFQQLAGNALAGGARPVDEVVEELLRPMLRNWLDTNLPSLVERLVREEIERVSRGRR